MEVEKPSEPAQESKLHKIKHSHHYVRTVSLILAAVILLGAGASAGYFYKASKADKVLKSSQATTASLQAKLAKSESDLAAAKKAASTSTTTTTTTTTPTTTCTAPTASNLDNIEASITSGNTAALEGYMASSVNVIIAASEGLGSRTPTQAVGDIAYINPGGTNTWDFALPAATITKYQAGSYKQYFPAGALVGKAADKHVVSFQFDCNGKINGVFMAASDDLL